MENGKYPRCGEKTTYKEEKMTKCPECGKEIEHLNARIEEAIWYRFDNSGYSEREEMEGGETIYFHCPECEEIIAETEEEAEKILGVEKISFCNTRYGRIYSR